MPPGQQKTHSGTVVARCSSGRKEKNRREKNGSDQKKKTESHPALTKNRKGIRHRMLVQRGKRCEAGDVDVNRLYT